MKTFKKLPIAFVVLFVFLGVAHLNAQNCGKAFYNAKVQYNRGQFSEAQNLLNSCITKFNSNSDSNEVFKFYKLYIASCNKNRDRDCAQKKTNDIVNFFEGRMSKGDVINRLNNTRF